ncbi:MAG TPA: hypothetical protein V6C57_04660 [Coleofasciculaceae cyanobacterium]
MTFSGSLACQSPQFSGVLISDRADQAHRIADQFLLINFLT